MILNIHHMCNNWLLQELQEERLTTINIAQANFTGIVFPALQYAIL